MSLLILFGGTPAPDPVFPQVQDNPVRRPERGELTIVTSLLLTTLAVTAVARAPVFMPVPEARQSHVQVHYRGAPIVAESPFSQPDWQSPAPRRAPEQVVGTTSLALTAVQAAPFVQTDWQPPAAVPRPLETPVVARPGPEVAADPVPFAQANWPVPKAARGMLAQQHFRAPAFDPTKPGLQTDWPNPVRPRIPAHEPGFSTLALTTVQAAPFVQSDWPVPLALAVQQPGEGTNFLSRFTQFAAQDSQWPLPVARKWQEQPEGYVNRLALTTPPAEVAPFAQTDWQKPWGARHPAPTMHFRGQEFDPTKPFAQSDWQNPRGKFVFQRDETINNLLLGYPEPPADTTAPRTGVYQPRVRPVQTQQQFTQNLLPLTSVEVVQSPFSQADWPNPVIRARAGGVELQRALPAQLYYTTYYAPSDNQWPNPVRARYVQQPWVVGNFLAQFVPYVAQDTLWPPPVGTRHVQQPHPVQNPLLLGIPDAPVVTPAVFGSAQDLPVVNRPSALQPRFYRGPSFDPTKPFHQDEWNTWMPFFSRPLPQQSLVWRGGEITEEPPVVAQDSEWIIRARRRGRR